MAEREIDADYLVVGGGAMGLAFTDTLLSETDATVAIVDRHHRPGGHWNDAYPFVRLHQPSAFYGVNSRRLGCEVVDGGGGNAGLYELASGAEVLAYFDQVLHQQFLPSGRMQYFPMNNYEGDRRFRSLLTGESCSVRARSRVVDATYMNVTVPSVRPPTYAVAAGIRCIPLNDLPRLTQPAEGYVVIGAGKTGIDACLWLLGNGIDPNTIRWIMPRDSWYLDRANVQPGDLIGRTLDSAARSTEISANALTADALFEALEADGVLLRLSRDVGPTMYRCATVTATELEQLRRLTGVVRMGRVRQIEPDRVVLDSGTIPTSAEVVHVDCSADGLERRAVLPVFGEDRITLQTVRSCQQVFSAAFIAHVEAAYAHDAEKNDLCTVVPHPDSDIDWMRVTLANTKNSLRWRRDDGLQHWLAASRLDAFNGTRVTALAAAVLAGLVGRIAQNTPGALANLQRLIEEAEVT